MLTPRLTDCPECADIPNLIKKIDCKLAEYANGLYNNVVFMLNQVVPAGAMIQLLAYKRILTYKQCNPDYLSDFCMDKIVSKVIRLTLGCDIKPIFTPTPTTSTTSTSTTCPPYTTSTTSSTSTSTSTTITSSTTTTTTTNICPDCILGTEIVIDTQIWSGCNLDVTTYSNGDPIPEVTDPIAWAALTTGAWCYYDNDLVTGTTYGKLYNAYAVNDPRGLAPTGWHIPTETEWNTLITYLGGGSVAGGKMKEEGLCHWIDPNTGATNISGFTGLPGGDRNDVSGLFNGLYYYGGYWSSTSTAFDNITIGTFSSLTLASVGSMYHRAGRSVRLIKNIAPTTTTTTTLEPTTTTTTTI